MERELEATLTRGGQTAVLVSLLKTSKEGRREGRREGWRARGHTDQREADSSSSVITKDL